MELYIKAERQCVGCGKRGQIDIEVRKVEAGLMFTAGSQDYNWPEGWVQPREWEDEKLRKSWRVDSDHLFCSHSCMYKYYEVE